MRKRNWCNIWEYFGITLIVLTLLMGPVFFGGTLRMNIRYKERCIVACLVRGQGTGEAVSRPFRWEGCQCKGAWLPKDKLE
jgi:hypothetical protein